MVPDLENTGGITGAITNNAGGTVTDSGTISGGVSGEGIYENNPISFVIITLFFFNCNGILQGKDDVVKIVQKCLKKINKISSFN